MQLTASHSVEATDPCVRELVRDIFARYGGEVHAEGFLDDACSVYSYDVALPARGVSILPELAKLPVSWISLQFY